MAAKFETECEFLFSRIEPTMKFCQLNRVVLSAVISILLLPPMATAASRTAPHKASTSHLTSHKTSAKSSAKAASPSSRRHAASARSGKSAKQTASVRRVRGQQGIDSERARDIQAALIREHYLDGEPSGVWDSRTREALSRFQGDNGWQTKVTPDSRALIKLGLGPTHEGLLNPESAAVPSRVSQLGAERVNPSGAMQR